MKKLEITLTSGKIYTGISNKKVYGGEIYLNRPVNGFITVTENGETFESFRKDMKIAVSDIKSFKEI